MANNRITPLIMITGGTIILLSAIILTANSGSGVQGSKSRRSESVSRDLSRVRSASSYTLMGAGSSSRSSPSGDKRGAKGSSPHVYRELTKQHIIESTSKSINEAGREHEELPKLKKTIAKMEASENPDPIVLEELRNRLAAIKRLRDINKSMMDCAFMEKSHRSKPKRSASAKKDSPKSSVSRWSRFFSRTPSSSELQRQASESASSMASLQRRASGSVSVALLPESDPEYVASSQRQASQSVSLSQRQASHSVSLSQRHASHSVSSSQRQASGSVSSSLGQASGSVPSMSFFGTPKASEPPAPPAPIDGDESALEEAAVLDPDPQSDSEITMLRISDDEDPDDYAPSVVIAALRDLSVNSDAEEDVDNLKESVAEAQRWYDAQDSARPARKPMPLEEQDEHAEARKAVPLEEQDEPAAAKKTVPPEGQREHAAALKQPPTPGEQWTPGPERGRIVAKKSAHVRQSSIEFGRSSDQDGSDSDSDDSYSQSDHERYSVISHKSRRTISAPVASFVRGLDGMSSGGCKVPASESPVFSAVSSEEVALESAEDSLALSSATPSPALSAVSSEASSAVSAAPPAAPSARSSELELGAPERVPERTPTLPSAKLSSRKKGRTRSELFAMLVDMSDQDLRDGTSLVFVGENEGVEDGRFVAEAAAGVSKPVQMPRAPTGLPARQVDPQASLSVEYPGRDERPVRAQSIARKQQRDPRLRDELLDYPGLAMLQ